MSLLDEVQRYSEGEEDASPDDLARIEAALAQAAGPTGGDGGDGGVAGGDAGDGLGAGDTSDGGTGRATSAGTAGASGVAGTARNSTSTIGLVAGGAAAMAIVAALVWPRGDGGPASRVAESDAPPVVTSAKPARVGPEPESASVATDRDEAKSQTASAKPRSATAGNQDATPDAVGPATVDAKPVERDRGPRTADADPRASAPTKADLNALLERAQNQRASGNAKAAAATYRKAIRNFPTVAAGRRALVALGDIELNQLGRAKAALEAYGRYLDKGSDPLLIQEAAYGRIRALRRLGRSGAERKAIDAFRRAHPDSPYVGALEKRIAELDTPSDDAELQSSDG